MTSAKESLLNPSPHQTQLGTKICFQTQPFIHFALTICLDYKYDILLPLIETSKKLA